MPDAPTPQEIEALLARVPQGYTPGPWKSFRWDTDRYPWPLSIHTTDDASWIARDGTCSSNANGKLLTLAPELATALRALAAENARLGEAGLQAIRERDAAHAAILELLEAWDECDQTRDEKKPIAHSHASHRRWKARNALRALVPPASVKEAGDV